MGTLTLRQARWARASRGAGRFLATFALIPLLGLAAVLAGSDGGSAATTFKTLYEFQQGSDGTNPEAGPVADASGNLYGTTTGGGAYGDGTVFKLTSPTAMGGA